MKLKEFINYLLEPEKLEILCSEQNYAGDIDSLLIYMKDRLDLNSDIFLFDIEETDDDIVYNKNGDQYIQLFPIDHSIELIETILDLKDKGNSIESIAKRLLEYRIKDA